MLAPRSWHPATLCVDISTLSRATNWKASDYWAMVLAGCTVAFHPHHMKLKSYTFYLRKNPRQIYWSKIGAV